MTFREILVGLILALFSDWITKVTCWLAKWAARSVPRKYRARWEEDWLADLQSVEKLKRVFYALSLFRAARKIKHEYWDEVKSRRLRSKPKAVRPSTVRLQEIVHVVDDFSLSEFTAVAAGYGQERFGYVVTPNVDHLIRFYEDAAFRAQYRSAEFILMDSRLAARLVYLLKGVRLPVCTGSDLTAHLLTKVIRPDDRIVMIGGSDAQARQIAERFQLTDLKHHNPPMGFIENPASVEECIEFVENASGLPAAGNCCAGPSWPRRRSWTRPLHRGFPQFHHRS